MAWYSQHKHVAVAFLAFAVVACWLLLRTYVAYVLYARSDYDDLHIPKSGPWVC